MRDGGDDGDCVGDDNDGGDGKDGDGDNYSDDVVSQHSVGHNSQWSMG